MRPRSSWLFLLLGWLLPDGTASAQTIDLLSQEGDPVVGFGLLEVVKNLVVNNEGGWLVLARAESLGGATEHVVLRQGFTAIGEGDSLAAPPGASIESLDSSSWRYDDSANILWTLYIDGPGVSISNRNCLYLNTRLLAREGFLVGASEGQVSPGTLYEAFLSFDFVTPRKILVFCRIEDPAAGSADAVVELTIDEFGPVEETRVLITRNQQFPVDLDPDDADPMVFKGYTPATRFHSVGVNRHGDFIWGAKTFTEPPGHYMLIGLHTIVARVGQSFSVSGSPNLDGRSIASFRSVEADINDFGDHVHTAVLNSTIGGPLVNTDEVLMVNGEVYIQEGQALPSLNGATVGRATDGPVYIANSRDVFWIVDLNNTLGSEDVAYMRNHDVILRKGLDFVDDLLVTGLRKSANSFSVSDDGRFWMAEVTLQGNVDAVVMTDFGLAVELPGCVGNPGTMQVRSGTVRAGDTLSLDLDNGQTPGVTTAVLISGRAPEGGGGGCGSMTPFGELFAVAPYALMEIGPPWVGTPAVLQLDIPNNIALVDSEWYAQGMFMDITGTLPEEDLRLTNGMRLEIGAP